MKKLIAIMVLFVYLPAIAGVGFSDHFCEGTLTNTEVFSFSKQSCCTEDPEEDDCCSDQVHIVKLEKDQLGSDSRVDVKQLAQNIALPSAVIVPQLFVGSFHFGKKFAFYSPPLLSRDISVLHCTYLI
jgi:hypothetical protein